MLILWTGSALAYAAAFASSATHWGGWRAWLRTYRNEIMVLSFDTVDNSAMALRGGYSDVALAHTLSSISA